jgi:LSD1 subclass zinc finger protein
MRVHPQGFEAMCNAVFAQQEHLHRLNESRGVYAMHPDGAPGDLQKRIGFSMFVQGWMPMLDEASVQSLLARTGLGAEYVESDPPKGDDALCASCGAPLTVFPGAKRVVCERCGHRLEVAGERLSCRGCGSPIAPPEGATNFACPHCKAPLQRIQMMKPG